MISEFPLFIFTTLAGLSTGAYVAGAVFGRREDAPRAWLQPLVCLLLLGFGLLGVLGHLGRPAMFVNALANPTSMIAEEAYWSIAFGVVVLVDAVLCFRGRRTPRALRVVGAVLGIVLMCVMANAYFTAHAVAVWTSWLTWPLYVAGDLAMGCALYGVFEKDRAGKPAFAIATGVIALVFAATCAAEFAAFSAAGEGAMPFAVGAVLAVASAVASIVGVKARPLAGVAWTALALSFAAVAIARYCFYAASIL